jgi:hypothetical protein
LASHRRFRLKVSAFNPRPNQNFSHHSFGLLVLTRMWY